MSDNRIALYLGDEIYPTAKNNPSETIRRLANSALTSPILSLINQNDNKLIFNDNRNYLFNEKGDYVGSSEFPDVCTELRRDGNIKELYASFSTSGTQFLKTQGAAFTQKVLSYLKNTMHLDGIDLDYEGGNFDKDGSLYFATEQIIAAGMKITAAPYDNSSEWLTWVEHVQRKGGTVEWLNLQCYGPGTPNPNDPAWNAIPAPILGGCNCAVMQPDEALSTVRNWADNQPSTPPAGPLSGGFFWAYSSMKSQYDLYLDAMIYGFNYNIQGPDT